MVLLYHFGKVAVHNKYLYSYKSSTPQIDTYKSFQLSLTHSQSSWLQGPSSPPLFELVSEIASCPEKIKTNTWCLWNCFKELGVHMFCILVIPPSKGAGTVQIWSSHSNTLLAPASPLWLEIYISLPGEDIKDVLEGHFLEVISVNY